MRLLKAQKTFRTLPGCNINVFRTFILDCVSTGLPLVVTLCGSLATDVNKYIDLNL